MKMATRSTTWLAALALSVACAGSSAVAGIIDDFSGDLSAYTATRILKATPAAANNVGSWQIGSGSLQFNTTTYNAIEQYALTRTDYTLGIGQEIQADYIASNLNSQDIGLYVGAGHPTPDVRANYVNIYVRNNGQLFSRGFNGTTELGLSGGGSPTVDKLFIARTAANAFDLGYYTGNVKTVLVSRTGLTSSSIGDAIGFYADIRGAGIRGNLDNLAIIPEPASIALLVGSLGVALIRRR
jgi:hypothetical protein